VSSYRGLTLCHQHDPCLSAAAIWSLAWSMGAGKSSWQSTRRSLHPSLAGRRRVLSAYQYPRLCTTGRPTDVSFASNLSINILLWPAIYFPSLPGQRHECTAVDGSLLDDMPGFRKVIAIAIFTADICITIVGSMSYSLLPLHCGSDV